MTSRLVRVLWDKAWFERIDVEKEFSLDNTRGDALANFNVENCRLSFFKVPDDSLVELIATAVAASRSSLDDVDYCLMDVTEIEGLGCEVDPSVSGSTLIDQVNGLHVDVCGLDVPKTCNLAYLAASAGEAGRVRSKRVRRLLLDAVEQQHIVADKLKPGLRKVLGLVENTEKA